MESLSNILDHHTGKGRDFVEEATSAMIGQASKSKIAIKVSESKANFGAGSAVAKQCSSPKSNVKIPVSLASSTAVKAMSILAGVDPNALSPRSESVYYAKKLVEDMQEPACSGLYPGEPEMLNKGTLRIQLHQVECELLQYDCGVIEAAAQDEEPVRVYLHVLRLCL